ncbi:bola domain protein [Saitoella complicata NRRL Y-17804]|nr:bola domain protein [Saitoella complicata NRRL Y-17804]ODQ49607.1 bola domain protein [Saitoella complicata NRRL Y-17804]
MLSRSLFRQLRPTQITNLSRTMFSAARSAGPLETVLREKITAEFQPLYLSITNDSHKHAHHIAMKDPSYANQPETHFRVTIASEKFEGKMLPARHRMVYALFKEEMARAGGIHALQLQTWNKKDLERRREAGEVEE